MIGLVLSENWLPKKLSTTSLSKSDWLMNRNRNCAARKFMRLLLKGLLISFYHSGACLIDSVELNGNINNIEQ